MDKLVKDMAFLLNKYGAKVGATDDFQADVLEVFETLKRKSMKKNDEFNAMFIEGCLNLLTVALNKSIRNKTKVNNLILSKHLQAIASINAEKTVIKAKALRKKGTKLFYTLRKGEFILFELPSIYHPHGLTGYNLPADAELINIEISYQPKQDKP